MYQVFISFISAQHPYITMYPVCVFIFYTAVALSPSNGVCKSTREQGRRTDEPERPFPTATIPAFVQTRRLGSKTLGKAASKAASNLRPGHTGPRPWRLLARAGPLMWVNMDNSRWQMAVV